MVVSLPPQRARSTVEAVQKKATAPQGNFSIEMRPPVGEGALPELFVRYHSSPLSVEDSEGVRAGLESWATEIQKTFKGYTPNVGGGREAYTYVTPDRTEHLVSLCLYDNAENFNFKLPSEVDLLKGRSAQSR